MDTSTLSLNTLSEHTTLTLLSAISVIALVGLAINPDPALRWFKRKRYQYEVTFSLYMLTPTEKFVFNSVLFLFLAMVTIAASLYLPSHVSTIGRRAYYYALGDIEAVHSVAAKGGASASSVAAEGSRTASEMVGESAEAASKVLGSATKAAQEAFKESMDALRAAQGS